MYIYHIYKAHIYIYCIYSVYIAYIYIYGILYIVYQHKVTYLTEVDN